MIKYELFFLDFSGLIERPKIVTKQFNAFDLSVVAAGVWATGLWASESIKTTGVRKFFFPMHNIKYIKKVMDEEGQDYIQSETDA